MKSNSIKSINYTPGDPPINSEQLQRFLRVEFASVGQAINGLAAGHMDPQPEPDPKPRIGDWRLSDGVNWDPLALGVPKMVWYNGAAWVAF